MFSDRQAEIDVKSLPIFSSIKFYSLISYASTNAREIGQDYGLIKAKKFVKRLQACARQVSILSRLTVQTYVFLTKVLCSPEIWKIMFRVPRRRRRKKFRRLQNNHKSRMGSIPSCCIRVQFIALFDYFQSHTVLKTCFFFFAMGLEHDTP